MSALALALDTRLGRRLMQPLTLFGRTAFTSYLGQTAIGVGVFYGVGLGLIATLGLAQLSVLALAIYALQVVFAASTWLRYFRQGPVEWGRLSGSAIASISATDGVPDGTAKLKARHW